MEKSMGIITPVLKYWGFKEHPFDDFILKEEALNLFIDREDELDSLHNSLTGRLCGVYGTQGSGKSSFLRKFESVMKSANIPVIYIQLMGTNEKALYREILSSFLKAHIDGVIKTDKSFSLKSKMELERVQFSIRLCKESEIGAQTFLKASTKEIREKKAEQHSEESAMVLIRNIIQNAASPFVVIIDDMERIKHFLEDEDTYFRFVTSFTRTVDEAFSDKKVCFVVSVDNQFVGRLNKNLPDDEGANSFSFGELIELKNFTPNLLIEVIRNRLNNRGWKKKVQDFISIEALLLLISVTGGHPRRTFALLRSSMEFVWKSNKSLFIDEDSLMNAIIKRKEYFDEKDFEIVKFLYKNGPSSISDDAMQKSIGLAKSTLFDRIKSLKRKVNLQSSQIQSGTTFKDVYSMEKLKI